MTHTDAFEDPTFKRGNQAQQEVQSSKWCGNQGEREARTAAARATTLNPTRRDFARAAPHRAQMKAGL